MYINNIKQIGIANSIETAKDFACSTSSQITKPITSNNNRDKNKNSYKIEKNNNHTTSSFSTKSFKKMF